MSVANKEYQWLDLPLEELWKKTFDAKKFERFNLHEIWSYVSKHKHKSIKSFLIDYIEMNIEEYDDEWFSRQGKYFLINLVNFPDLLPSISNFSIDETMPKMISLQKLTAPLPTKFLVELTNNCNLQCIMCGVGELPYDSSKTITVDIFHQLIQSISMHSDPSIMTYRLNGLGESTILPNFLDYLRLVPEQSHVELVTNLTIDKPEMWRELIKRDALLLV